jgi:hypothetical protein
MSTGKLKGQIRIETPVSLRVSAEWLEALDRWRESQPVKPSRTAVILAAVRQFIASQKSGAGVLRLKGTMRGETRAQHTADEADEADEDGGRLYGLPGSFDRRRRPQ